MLESKADHALASHTVVTMSATSAQLLQCDVSAEVASPLGTYAPESTRLRSMLATLATVDEYSHYRMADTTASPTADDRRHMPRFKAQGEGLHPTLEIFVVKYICTS